MKERWFVPYRYKMVEKISVPEKSERWNILKSGGFNMFSIPSEKVYIDLLTDSGTGTMSDKQWSAIVSADESYAGSRSFFDIKKSVKEIMGFDNVLPVHQGRAAEKVLNSVLIKEGMYVPGNTHFDTTKAHIENAKGRCIDVTISESENSNSNYPFKGNLDINRLEKEIEKVTPQKVAYILITVTCNSGGGQPVSMKNIKDVSKIARKYGLKLFFDAARFAENCYFIKTREDGYQNKTVREISNELFSYSDGFTMSSKKDAIVPMGGLLVVRDINLFDMLKPFVILNEGYLTYGGMSGMTMAALAQGLYESTDFEYLHYRIGQVKMLGELLKEASIPVVTPIGGHAVFIDGRRFFPNIPEDQFPAQYLCAALYEAGGVRTVEVGANLADRDPDTGENIRPKLDLCRLAIPRRSYSFEHMMYIVETVKEVFQNSKNITSGFQFDFESKGIRHFSSTFKLVDSNKDSLFN
ncbi:tryptophanase [bacterium]|nr:tryptophanase [bacterium]